MDRYKFRGKLVDESITDIFTDGFCKDGWVYGNLVSDSIIASGVVDVVEDCITFESWAKVDPTTVGQYSTVNLKDHTELYAGDIVQHVTAKWIGTVIFADGAFKVKSKHGTWVLDKLRAERLVKLGTVHDNPDLLEG